jgi:hypothetical protein
MNVSPEQTQAPADELVSYEGFLGRLQRLASSPRVMVKKLGQSHGGRGLYCILVADEETVSRLEHHWSLSTSLQLPAVVHRTLSHIEVTERPGDREDVRFPVLIAGLSFGHEASHVEGHLDLAERLAWADDEEVQAILDKLIVLILPMMNPDGRDMSIEIWRQYPLAEDSSAGNLYGFYLNRDFIHVTQPEARAVVDVYRDWHPIALLDTHEDVFSLGVEAPEVCWCPYQGQAPAEDAPAGIQPLISRLAEAIRQEWEGLGFKYMERNMFAHPMLGEPEEGPYWVALGTLVDTMVLHGMPSVITESGRTPGVQTWEDRVRQKYAAGMALLKELAKDPSAVASEIHRYRREAVDQTQRSPRAFVIAKDQDECGALVRLLDTLLSHDVKVYETDLPYPSYVVPLAQAESDMARTLLSTRDSKLAALGPALGVAVTPLEALPQDQRAGFEGSPLTPVVELPVPALTVVGASSASSYAIPNTTEGVQLVNRLWGLGSPVRWLTTSASLGKVTLKQGTFVTHDVPKSAVQTLAQGLVLEIHSVPEGTRLEGYTLARPKVGLYTGQGVDTPDASTRGDIAWALDHMGFEYVPLVAEDMRPDLLGRYDILIVPDGDAHEIVHGWDPEAPLNAPPWELPGEPHGVGQKGLEALRQYVEAGGLYFGIGSGGGLLALADYAGLIDLEVMAHSLGSARVLLQVNDPEHPLMFGLDGYYDEDGTWVDGFFPAQYHSETFTCRPGGPVFGAGKASTALACYYRADHDPERLQIVNESLLSEEQGGIAIGYQRVGKGQVVVAGIRPGFRAVWTNTWKLISNAIFLAAAGRK